jgi:hypothetical protein
VREILTDAPPRRQRIVDWRIHSRAPGAVLEARVHTGHDAPKRAERIVVSDEAYFFGERVQQRRAMRKRARIQHVPEVARVLESVQECRPL